MDEPLEVFLAAKEVWLWNNQDKFKARIPKKKKGVKDESSNKAAEGL